MSKSQVAFVFPGQGSQVVGMLSEFAEDAIVKQTFEEASDSLGYDMWQLVSQGPAEKLNETEKTQPALLTASTALWRLWLQNNETPSVVAGHSLGEYSALVAANALDFSTGVKLVERRGEFMQQAVPSGTGKMAAIIGLADDLIVQACEEAAQTQVVSPVNYNSPGQVVIAGNADAVERAMVLCKEKGAKRALPLPVSAPSHCSLMIPAAEALSEVLSEITIKAPEIKLINNVDVAAEVEQSRIKDALVRQLYSPVRWTETIQHVASEGIEILVECGPGNVLSGLAKRIDRSLTSYQMGKKGTFDQVVGALC
ncbi:ACP S-malonyltransferase [Aliikangiella coralliicola]|uniref:Malonyl CoA-acyl carrier protein transacylase n=1 Tax=Aliikangiella coralliicola TaxID=2592383 RepID=A0A545UD47_9GAMM|nr:ACP S-malonyltransferase [Aliikangiella coralliicola]TQV87388.1 ACP S-malonyltransferase [Aliikangiella coralliicola]